jgi:hypothetical protein
LVATARHYGVPVNVPDQIDLCSFYLASIVDRAPLYSNPFQTMPDSRHSRFD